MTVFRMRWIILALCLSQLACSGASDQNSERNVILRTAPFYEHELRRFSETDSNSVINEGRAFASEKRMDFLLSRDDPDPGDFSLTLAGRDLNLKVMHVKAIGGGLSVFAIARGKPTNEDWLATREFACRTFGKCPAEFRGHNTN